MIYIAGVAIYIAEMSVDKVCEDVEMRGDDIQQRIQIKDIGRRGVRRCCDARRCDKMRCRDELKERVRSLCPLLC